MGPQHVDAAVVIPVYNRSQGVLQALDSVARQTRPPRAVVVVDDGSTDDTANSVRQWARRNAQTPLRLVQQVNQGASCARNRGLASAGDHPYVAFLDSDDLWPCDFLERLVSRLVACPSAVAASTDYLRVDYHRWRRKLKSQRALENRPRATERIFQSNIQVQTCLCRTEMLRKLGGFNPAIPTGEDLELMLRLSVLGPWLHAPGKPIIYRLGYCEGRGEHRSLSTQFADNHRQWARIRERFLLRQGGLQLVSADVYRRVLNSGWRRAARELLRAGRVEEAEECFARALLWKPDARWELAWTRTCGWWDRKLSQLEQQYRRWAAPRVPQKEAS